MHDIRMKAFEDRVIFKSTFKTKTGFCFQFIFLSLGKIEKSGNDVVVR